MFSGLKSLFRTTTKMKAKSLLVDSPSESLYKTADGRIAVAAKPKPQKPIIHLETLPPDGLISQYGVHVAHTADDKLDHYSEEYRTKLEIWKSRITRK